MPLLMYASCVEESPKVADWAQRSGISSWPTSHCLLRRLYCASTLTTSSSPLPRTTRRNHRPSSKNSPIKSCSGLKPGSYASPSCLEIENHRASGRRICFTLIPSHCGIPGNEFVDTLASQGRTAPSNGHLHNAISPEEKIAAHRRNLSTSIIAGFKHNQFNCAVLARSSLGPFPWLLHPSRRIHTSLFRLRSGHNRLNYHMSKIDSNIPQTVRTTVIPTRLPITSSLSAPNTNPSEGHYVVSSWITQAKKKSLVFCERKTIIQILSVTRKLFKTKKRNHIFILRKKKENAGQISVSQSNLLNYFIYYFNTTGQISVLQAALLSCSFLVYYFKTTGQISVLKEKLLNFLFRVYNLSTTGQISVMWVVMNLLFSLPLHWNLLFHML